MDEGAEPGAAAASRRCRLSDRDHRYVGGFDVVVFLGPLPGRSNRDRRHGTGGTGVGASQAPTVVARPAAGNDVAGDVFYDEIFAADAEQRLRAKIEATARSRIPPDD